MTFQKQLTLTVLSLVLTVISLATQAQNLFSVYASGSNLTVTPVLNKYYPSMGIKIPSGTKQPKNCSMNSNGYCLFASSKSNPKVLKFANTNNSLLVKGSICLIGSCELNCQTYDLNNNGKCNGPGGVCRAFISKATHNGNFSSYNADTQCNTEAKNSGLGGVYIAWLSLNNEFAVTRYNTATTLSRAKTINTCSPTTETVFGPTPQFWLDTRSVEISCYADGTIATSTLGPYAQLWSGLDQFGAPTISGTGNCSGWTSSTASAGVVGYSNYGTSNSRWTSSDAVPCSGDNNWYCIEVPN